jgi:hypothetical protein
MVPSLIRNDYRTRMVTEVVVKYTVVTPVTQNIEVLITRGIIPANFILLEL